MNLEKNKRKWSANEPIRTSGISFESDKMFKELIQINSAINCKIDNIFNVKDDFDDLDSYNDSTHETIERKVMDENEEGKLI